MASSAGCICDKNFAAAAIGHLDAVPLVGEEHEHVPVAGIERGVGLGDLDIAAEFAGTFH
jgi:hypothetical protein